MFLITDRAAEALARLFRCDLETVMEGCGEPEAPAIVDGVVRVEGEELFKIDGSNTPATSLLFWGAIILVFNQKCTGAAKNLGNFLVEKVFGYKEGNTVPKMLRPVVDLLTT